MTINQPGEPNNICGTNSISFLCKMVQHDTHDGNQNQIYTKESNTLMKSISFAELPVSFGDQLEIEITTPLSYL